jgi:DNA-binding IclR family transcriptional regulator
MDSAPGPDAPIEQRVLHALRENVTPASPTELAATLGVAEKTLQRLLGKMAREGSVRRAGGGRFTTSRHYR